MLQTRKKDGNPQYPHSIFRPGTYFYISMKRIKVFFKKLFVRKKINTRLHLMFHYFRFISLFSLQGNM